MMLLVWLCAFLMIPWVADAEVATEVVFERQIEVSRRETYSWADLVVLKGGDTELLNRLEKMNYASGGAAEIREVWRRARSVGELTGRERLYVPSEFQVRVVEGFSVGEFRRKVLNRLAGQCAECAFEWVQERTGSSRISGPWFIDFSQVLPRSQLLVPVQSTAGTAWIPVHLRIRRPAWVVRRPVTAGKRFEADDVERRMVDSDGRGTLVGEADFTEAIWARSFSPGQTVPVEALKREELVRRGQTVRLVSAGDDFEIAASAIAEESGRRGDVIKVRGPDAAKILSAVVSGAGQVRLQ